MPIFVLAAAENAGTKKQKELFYLVDSEIGKPYTVTKDIEQATLFDENSIRLIRAKNAMGAMGGVANKRDVQIVEIEV